MFNSISIIIIQPCSSFSDQQQSRFSRMRRGIAQRLQGRPAPAGKGGLPAGFLTGRPAAQGSAATTRGIPARSLPRGTTPSRIRSYRFLAAAVADSPLAISGCVETTRVLYKYTCTLVHNDNNTRKYSCSRPFPAHIRQ